jgi:hypothetical protein
MGEQWLPRSHRGRYSMRRGLLCPAQTLLEENGFKERGPPSKHDAPALDAHDDIEPNANCTKPDKAEWYDHNGVYRAVRIPEGTF